MNDTVINIAGIKVVHEIIDMQDSTDQSHILVIKDEHGNISRTTICFGKITEVEWKE